MKETTIQDMIDFYTLKVKYLKSLKESSDQSQAGGKRKPKPAKKVRRRKKRC